MSYDTRSDEAYPSKPIRIIVPYPPGGFNDTLGRSLAAKFQQTWKQPVIVDNRAGGGTIIGTELVAKAAADGHTLLIGSFAFAANVALYQKLPYDTLRDFAPIVLCASTSNILVANPQLKANDARELIALAKAQPGAINYASGGNGSSVHLAMELFKNMAGIDLQHIPYKGSAPAVQDLLSGQVSIMFDNVPNVIGHIRAGKMRALAASGRQRAALLPNVPTLAENALPGFEMEVWFGLLAPGGTPAPIVEKLQRETQRVLAQAEVKQRFAAQGVESVGAGAQAFAAHLSSEIAKWTKLIRATGISAD